MTRGRCAWEQRSRCNVKPAVSLQYFTWAGSYGSVPVQRRRSGMHHTRGFS